MTCRNARAAQRWQHPQRAANSVASEKLKGGETQQAGGTARAHLARELSAHALQLLLVARVQLGDSAVVALLDAGELFVERVSRLRSAR